MGIKTHEIIAALQYAMGNIIHHMVMLLSMLICLKL